MGAYTCVRCGCVRSTDLDFISGRWMKFTTYTTEWEFTVKAPPCVPKEVLA